MTFAISTCKYGGFYYLSEPTIWRLSLGWITLTFFPMELDVLLKELTRRARGHGIERWVWTDYI